MRIKLQVALGHRLALGHRVALGVVLAWSSSYAIAQAPFSDLPQKPAPAKPAAVSYLFPEQVTLVAGKHSRVDLHFKVAEGLHVNSHNPHTDDLIPTTLKFPEKGAVLAEKIEFPAGEDYAFAASPTEKLSVYTGEFILRAELVAPKGEHLVEATLRYQACNNSTCMPPRSIPVAIDVIAK
jgi:hypothetical protein